MIITKVLGGLGNQMFQYAAGRALALSRNVELRLDISGFNSYSLHNGYELDKVFNLNCRKASKENVASVLGWQTNHYFQSLVKRFGLHMLCRKSLLIEHHFHYCSSFNSMPQDSYIDGYWQSDKYFSNYSKNIKSDFSFAEPKDQKNLVLIEKIKKSNSVAVHIRRGDYVTNRAINNTHSLCDLDYYDRAFKFLADRVESAHFFIFSDDFNWVNNNLHIDYPHEFVSQNHGESSYIDMYLMSLCQHHIIANSTFSWWGAWLADASRKIVIAPQNWFVNDNVTEDLYPHDWIKL